MNAFDFKRILILGDTGFIGNHLKSAFRDAVPQLEIIGRSRRSGCDLTQVESTQGLSDLLDAETLVIMCAALKRQFGDTPEAYMQNVQMMINLCRLLDKRPVKRLIFFSSSAVYGEDIHNTHITEETSVQPTSFYGIAKYVSERMCLKTFAGQPPGSLVILRPSLVYGPGDEGDTYGPVKFVRSAARGEEIVLWGDGEELREFIFIDDLVKIVQKLAFSTYEGVLNVVSGMSYSFKDVLDCVSCQTQDPLRVATRPRTKNKVDNAFNAGRLYGVMKRFVFTDLNLGVKRTLDAQREMTHAAQR